MLKTLASESSFWGMAIKWTWLSIRQYANNDRSNFLLYSSIRAR